MCCFRMHGRGRMSVHLCDEKSSDHFDNPSRHTAYSEPRWGPAQMGCTRNVGILSPLVNESPGEESSWQTRRRVPQRGEVIGKRVCVRTTADNKDLSSLLQVFSF